MPPPMPIHLAEIGSLVWPDPVIVGPDRREHHVQQVGTVDPPEVRRFGASSGEAKTNFEARCREPLAAP